VAMGQARGERSPHILGRARGVRERLNAQHGGPRFGSQPAIAASVSTISAVAASLVLHLVRIPPEPAAVRPEQYQPTVVVSESSVVLVQDDRVVAVLTSQR
jgi:hypothetical protein